MPFLARTISTIQPQQFPEFRDLELQEWQHCGKQQDEVWQASSPWRDNSSVPDLRRLL